MLGEKKLCRSPSKRDWRKAVGKSQHQKGRRTSRSRDDLGRPSRWENRFFSTNQDRELNEKGGKWGIKKKWEVFFPVRPSWGRGNGKFIGHERRLHTAEGIGQDDGWKFFKVMRCIANTCEWKSGKGGWGSYWRHRHLILVKSCELQSGTRRGVKAWWLNKAGWWIVFIGEWAICRKQGNLFLELLDSFWLIFMR